MGLREEYERGINDPDAPRESWWIEHAVELYAVFALVVLGVLVAFKGFG